MSLEGEIGEIDLIARLVELGREQFTGAIRFENDGIIKILYFKGGDVLSASTNDRADSIDEILLRAGKVTREHVKQALAKRKESETLGDALLNLGFITRKELTWARRVQAIGVIRSIGAWAAGSYTIVSDYLPKREEGTLFPLPQIIVELVVTDQDRVKFDRLLDSGEAVFAKAPDFDDTFRRLGLNEDASKITNEVDGRRSAAEVAASAGSDAFNVYKLLHALSALGLLERVAKPEVKSELSFDTGDDLASAGVADASDMWTSTAPSFELDDAPAFDPMAETVTDLPMMSFDAPAPEPVLASEPELDFGAPVAPLATEPPPSPMPAWDTPSPTTIPGAMPSWDDDDPVAAPMMAAPPPIPMPPSRPRVANRGDAGAEEWGGFDEAQIETARRAAVPVSSSLAGEDEPSMAEAVAEASKPNRWVRTLLLAVLIVIVGFGGYAGFVWWQGRQPDTSAELVQPVKRAKLRPRGAGAGTETTGTSTMTTSTMATSSGTSTGAAATTASTDTMVTGISSAKLGTAPTTAGASGGTSVAMLPPTSGGAPSTSAATRAGAMNAGATAPTRPGVTIPTSAAAHPGAAAPSATAPSAASAASGRPTPGRPPAARPSTPAPSAGAPSAPAGTMARTTPVRPTTAHPGASAPSAAAPSASRTAAAPSAGAPSAGSRPTSVAAGSSVATTSTTSTSAPRITHSATGATISNTGAPATASTSASADPQRERYAARAREHAAAPPAGKFTVQFELVCQTSSLTTALRAGGDRIWFVPITYRGQPCYRVFWGSYDTQEAARAGAGELPSSLRGGAAPVVVHIPR